MQKKSKFVINIISTKKIQNKKHASKQIVLTHCHRFIGNYGQKKRSIKHKESQTNCNLKQVEKLKKVLQKKSNSECSLSITMETSLFMTIIFWKFSRKKDIEDIIIKEYKGLNKLLEKHSNIKNYIIILATKEVG